MVPSITTPAIVLHVMPYGETSAIVRLFARDLGLTSGIARSTRLQIQGTLTRERVPELECHSAALRPSCESSG